MRIIKKSIIISEVKNVHFFRSRLISKITHCCCYFEIFLLKTVFHGSGFSEDKFRMPGDNDPNSGNHVHMYNDKVSFKCEINKDSNNDKGIQCWTPPGIGDVGTLKIKVRADGVDSNTKTWKAQDKYTPSLEKLTPQQCEPGTVVNAEGTMYTGMWNSTMNTNQIENTDICTNNNDII